MIPKTASERNLLSLSGLPGEPVIVSRTTLPLIATVGVAYVFLIYTS